MSLTNDTRHMNDTQAHDDHNNKRKHNDRCTTQKLVSIDIGINNMGITTATVDPREWEIISIDHVEKVDINDLPHRRVPRDACTLCHTRNMVDKMGHFLQEYEPFFRDAHEVLIERQPITGLQAVEQLFLSLSKNREVMKQKHPTTMHIHFGIKELDYDQRKEKTVEIGRKYLTGVPLLYFDSLERQHDVSDAICQLIHHVAVKRKALCYKRRKDAAQGVAIGIDPQNPERVNPFDQWAWHTRPQLYYSVGKEPKTHQRTLTTHAKQWKDDAGEQNLTKLMWEHHGVRYKDTGVETTTGSKDAS